MNDTDNDPNSSFLPDELQDARLGQIAAGLLWVVAATIYGLDASGTSDFVVGGIFGGLALYYFAIAAVADGSPSQERSCRWAWGW